MFDFEKTLYFEDDQYPNNGFDHIRKVVRAIVYDDNKNICLNKVDGNDIFGHRDYFETPGGGVEEKETLEEALKRELDEELGAEVEIIRPLLIIEDYYNLINRKNINYYYLCHLKSLHKPHLQEGEGDILKGNIWVSIDKAIELFNTSMNGKVALLVKQRELPIIELAKIYLEQ